MSRRRSFNGISTNKKSNRRSYHSDTKKDQKQKEFFNKIKKEADEIMSRIQQNLNSIETTSFQQLLTRLIMNGSLKTDLRRISNVEIKQSMRKTNKNLESLRRENLINETKLYELARKATEVNPNNIVTQMINNFLRNSYPNIFSYLDYNR